MNAELTTALESQDFVPDAKKVLVVDRSEAVCDGVSNLLQSQQDLQVCGVAREAKSGLRLFRQQKPEVVVTGITLPGMDGFKMTEVMLAEEPGTRVLIHSVRDDIPYGLRALRMGAKGFVRKGLQPATLIKAVRHVAFDGLYLSPKLKQKLVSHAIGSEDRESTSPLGWLTDREQAVFRWLGKGLSAGEIAEKMATSTGAIEAYRCRIREKLGLADLHALVRYALQWELTNRDGRAVEAAADHRSWRD